MDCKDLGFIQAYLDNEVTREERKKFAIHLQSCQSCRDAIEELHKLERWSNLALEESLPDLDSPDKLVIDTEAAWNRFTARLQAENPIPSSEMVHKAEKPNKERGLKMTSTYKKWFAGTAVAAVLLGSFTIPQVQAAATQFLSIFRVDKVQFVKITQDDVTQIKQWLDEGKNGEMNIKGLGKVWIEGKDKAVKDRVRFASLEEARQAGVEVADVPANYKVTQVSVTSSFTLSFQLDTEKANKLLKQIKSESQFDSELDGKKFSITFPGYYDVELSGKGNGASDYYSYTVMEAPKMSAPKDVDLDQLRNTILSLPFITEPIKQQLFGIKDWKHTLPIPLMNYSSDNLKEITVNGSPAILAKSENSYNLMVQKGGKLISLYTYSEHADANKLIKLAEKL